MFGGFLWFSFEPIPGRFLQKEKHPCMNSSALLGQVLTLPFSWGQVAKGVFSLHVFVLFVLFVCVVCLFVCLFVCLSASKSNACFNEQE